MHNLQNGIDPSITFIDALYYEETHLPMRSQYLAVQQILEFAWLGLGMCGDKNHDGKLEYHELLEYCQYMQSMFNLNADVLNGLKVLLKNYSCLAGEKRYLDDKDLLTYKDLLLTQLCIEGLSRSSLVPHIAADITELLAIELVRNSNLQLLIAQVNETLELRQATARINASGVPVYTSAFSNTNDEQDLLRHFESTVSEVTVQHGQMQSALTAVCGGGR